MARMCTGKQIPAWAMKSRRFKSEHDVEITEIESATDKEKNDLKIETFNEARVQFYYYYTINDNPDIPVHKHVLWGRSAY